MANDFFLTYNLQDTQLEELKQSVSSLQAKNEQLQTTVSQQLAQIQQHKDQYNVLKVQLGMRAFHFLFVIAQFHALYSRKSKLFIFFEDVYIKDAFTL